MNITEETNKQPKFTTEEPKSIGFDFREKQVELYDKFQAFMIQELTPIVNELIEHLRSIEKETIGGANLIIEEMLKNNDINKPMYDILIDSIKDLEEDYTVDLTKTTN